MKKLLDVCLLALLGLIAFTSTSIAFAQGATHPGDGLGSLDDLVKHYTSIVIAGGITAIGGLLVKGWHWLSHTNAAKKAKAAVENNGMLKVFASQAIAYARQQVKAKKADAGKIKETALGYWHRVAAAHRVPPALIAIGDEMIETAVAEANSVTV